MWRPESALGPASVLARWPKKRKGGGGEEEDGCELVMKGIGRLAGLATRADGKD